LQSIFFVAGIYIHIPFCKQACHYCDFHFSTNRSDQSQLVAAIIRELDMRKDYLEGEAVNTIYFGGGTPSLLSGVELDAIMQNIRQQFPVSESAEITLEANPGDLTRDKLQELRTFGINRLSIGIQSFHDNVLQYLNRDHDGLSAVASVKDARAAGITNISIDLIYSIPDQSDLEWRANVLKAIELKPAHISAYSLTIEPKTVFGNWATKKKLTPVDDDVSARQFEILVDELELAGYEHYEVSNFCLPGFYSRHNSSYWKGEKYLGVGPAAHSYNTSSRQHNVRNNAIYTRSIIDEGKVPFELEVLTREDKVNDYLLTTLRTSWGCDLSWLRDTFGYDVEKEHQKYLNELLSLEFASYTGGRLTLTRKGKLMADKIASDLFLTTN
jgi:oxygen-independent coproporphyrinogen III oxidase